MKLETKRLILRNPVQKDAKDIAEGLSPLGVRRYIPKVPHPYTLTDAKSFVKNSKGKQKFVIELKESGKVVGGTSIHKIDYALKKAGVGYWLSKNYWRKGLVSEAIREVLRFAFEDLHLERIILTCNKDNKGSVAIAKKFGFKLKETIKNGHCPNATGKISDKLIYVLLKKDF